MGIFSSIGKALGDLTGANDAAKASQKAADQQLAFQQQGLDYLKETQAPVLARREAAAEPLLGFYTSPVQQAQFYQDAQASPAFDYLQGLGEESILRNASATGGLRGGNTQEALSTYAPKLAMDLVNQRLSGLQGFAGQGVNAGQVANQYGQMGATQAGGTLAAGQAQQQGIGQLMNLGFGAIGAAGNLGWNPFGSSSGGGLI